MMRYLSRTKLLEGVGVLESCSSDIYSQELLEGRIRKVRQPSGAAATEQAAGFSTEGCDFLTRHTRNTRHRTHDTISGYQETTKKDIESKPHPLPLSKQS